MNVVRRILTPVLLVIPVAPGGVGAQAPAALRCSASPHAPLETDLVAFPQGEVFCPLVADPKDHHTFLSFITGEFPTLSALGYDTEVGSVGLADGFNLLRWGGPHAEDGIQIGLSGGVFAQFDLRSPSFDLINADYVVGFPITMRRSDLSVRIRPYHQSSHLGDEFVLRMRAGGPAPPAADGLLDPDGAKAATAAFDFEAVDLLVSRDVGRARFYGGGEWLYRRHPETLDDLVAHGGAELRSEGLGGRHVVVAVDVRAREEYAWTPAWSVRAGVELATWSDHDHAPREWRVLVEYFDGPPPFGRSFRERLRWVGIGLHLSR